MHVASDLAYGLHVMFKNETIIFRNYQFPYLISFICVLQYKYATILNGNSLTVSIKNSQSSTNEDPYETLTLSG